MISAESRTSEPWQQQRFIPTLKKMSPQIYGFPAQEVSYDSGNNFSFRYHCGWHLSEIGTYYYRRKYFDRIRNIDIYSAGKTHQHASSFCVRRTDAKFQEKNYTFCDCWRSMIRNEKSDLTDNYIPIQLQKDRSSISARSRFSWRIVYTIRRVVNQT